ncbi:MAG: hypothetical protein ACUBOA_13450 [Candidatus Loosdrechtia sp.]|uniref:hypothetical protein n=1 Tax=Candidatus Loosdrechtia sp. TaxID=3101272 RepID=UPI003A7325F6|nr:MAG: hypothetical protein QY305_02985 [Candidatus Jettenia sp. AMX2]
MNVKLIKYCMFKPKSALEIDTDTLEALKKITEKNPRLTIDLLIDIALDYIASLEDEKLLKLITEYYGRKHPPQQPE